MSIIKGTNKVVAGFGGTKENIGDVKWSYSKLATDNSGRLPLFTGETIASANTIYPEFYNWVLAHTELQCTSAQYEASLTTYGECAKYVIGDGSLRLPLIRNYIKAANPSEGIKNIEAGLPNITGTVPDPLGGGNGTWTGAFAKGALNNTVTASNVDYDGYEVTFDASRSSNKYGKSSTVTPASTTLYPWVVAYVAAIPASTAQAAAFQQGLSGKADTNLGNVPSNYDYVVDRKVPTESDPSWYEVWKSGKVRQGGELAASTSQVLVHTYLKPFVGKYVITTGIISSDNYTKSVQLLSILETSFSYKVATDGGTLVGNKFFWIAEGQGA